MTSVFEEALRSLFHCDECGLCGRDVLDTHQAIDFPGFGSFYVMRAHKPCARKMLARFLPSVISGDERGMPIEAWAELQHAMDELEGLYK